MGNIYEETAKKLIDETVDYETRHSLAYAEDVLYGMGQIIRAKAIDECKKIINNSPFYLTYEMAKIQTIVEFEALKKGGIND